MGGYGLREVWVKGVQLAMDIRNRWHGMKILVSLNSKFVKYNYSALGHSYSAGNRVKERVYKERLVGLLILMSPSKRPGPPLAISSLLLSSSELSQGWGTDTARKYLC